MADQLPAGLPPDLRLVVALVGEGEQLDHVRAAAVDLARHTGARLILYDRDAGKALGDPMPTAWSAQGTENQYGDPLSVKELRTLGQNDLARQVDGARKRGADAWGWPPATADAGELLAYARRHRADVLVLPAEPTGPPTLLDRLLGRPAGTDPQATAAEAARGPAVVLVEADGGMRLATGHGA